jgi:hypothetical protein
LERKLGELKPPGCFKENFELKFAVLRLEDSIEAVMNQGDQGGSLIPPSLIRVPDIPDP